MFADANCVGLDSEIWYPLETDLPGIRKAKAICAECPAMRDCLNVAMEAETGASQYRFGLFGGLTPRERADLARRLGAVA
jgi:WhiB family redox-sensing transcriptional regulator